MIALTIDSTHAEYRSEKDIMVSPALAKSLSIAIVRTLGEALGQAGIDEKASDDLIGLINRLFLGIMAGSAITGVKKLSEQRTIVFSEKDGGYVAACVTKEGSKDAALDVFLAALPVLFSKMQGDIDSVFFGNDLAEAYGEAYRKGKEKADA